MYMYSEVYVRYVFGFVLIISLRLDRRRQRSFSCQSWKLESLAAPRGGGRQGGDRETKQMQVR